MNVNTYFENGIVDYFRGLFVYDGLIDVKSFVLYRVGDMYYSCCGGILVGVRKVMVTKDDRSSVGDIFCYHDCRNMERFKYVSTIEDDSIRRKYSKERCIYSFLNDVDRVGVLMWHGRDVDLMIYLNKCSLGSYSSEVLNDVFGGLLWLCGYYGSYFITCEEFYYGEERWVRFVCPYWVVCICLGKKCKSIDRIYRDYRIGLSYMDYELNRKKDTLFKGLRINA